MISEVPDSLCDFSRLPNLRHLNLSYNRLSSLTSNVLALTSLEVLRVRGNRISYIGKLSPLTRLSLLDLSYNRLMHIEHDEIPYSLQKLNLSHNQLYSLRGIGLITSLTSLRVSNNKISLLGGNSEGDDFCDEGCNNECNLFDLKLKLLDISRNKLQRLEESIGKMTTLQHLDISFNLLQVRQNLQAIQTCCHTILLKLYPSLIHNYRVCPWRSAIFLSWSVSIAL